MKADSGLTLSLDGDDVHCLSVLFEWLLKQPSYQIKLDDDRCIETHHISQGMIDRINGL